MFLLVMMALAFAHAGRAATWYVATNGSDAADGTAWATAKRTIQAAIDLAQSNDLVVVSNGVYDTGGRVVFGAMTNRVAITNAITVQSANGPAVTFIHGAGPLGDGAVRCAYVGGGAFSALLNRCIVSGNSAALNGGGAYAGVLDNCLLSGNAAQYGGGSCTGRLNSCTLSGNSATAAGGGSYYDTLNNCIVYGNTGGTGSNHVGSIATFSCSTPLPDGKGNIALDPQFEDTAMQNYRLRAGSPCIDRGTNIVAQGQVDLDGEPRIRFGTVDMGAYEFQAPLGYWGWAEAITNGLAGYGDSAAGDGHPNLLRYATGSSATDGNDMPRLRAWVSNNVPVLEFSRNTNATDVILITEGSEVAANDSLWMGIATNSNGSWGGAPNVVELGITNPVRVRVMDAAPLATNRFMRLRVIRP